MSKNEISKTVLWKVRNEREITSSKMLLIRLDNQATQRKTIYDSNVHNKLLTSTFTGKLNLNSF